MVEVAEEAVWAPVEETETAPVAVVEEAEPWSGAHRHGAEEAHSLQALLVEKLEKVAVVEAPSDAGTPARAWHSVQVVAGPRVVRVEAPEPRVARRGARRAPGPRVALREALGARLKALGPRMARTKAPSPRRV
jgi:hypothetical protein